jgi:AcrR family transcriptional regulator
MQASGGQPGIRERKRQAVRDHLSDVALRLLADRSFDSVTVDEIAAAAGVSRRTFFRYFTSKEEVVLSFLDEMGARLHDAIVARPPDEPPLAAVHSALRPRIAAYAADAERTLRFVRLLQMSPSLRAQELERRSRLRELVADAISLRLGLDLHRDTRPRLLASIALVPFDVAVATWFDSRPEADLGDLLDETIRALSGELRNLS